MAKQKLNLSILIEVSKRPVIISVIQLLVINLSIIAGVMMTSINELLGIVILVTIIVIGYTLIKIVRRYIAKKEAEVITEEKTQQVIDEIKEEI